MDSPPKAASDAIHDETLIDWFLALEPIERLAELESRLEFFNAVRGRRGTTCWPEDTSC